MPGMSAPVNATVDSPGASGCAAQADDGAAGTDAAATSVVAGCVVAGSVVAGSLVTSSVVGTSVVAASVVAASVVAASVAADAASDIEARVGAVEAGAAALSLLHDTSTRAAAKKHTARIRWMNDVDLTNPGT